MRVADFDPDAFDVHTSNFVFAADAQNAQTVHLEALARLESLSLDGTQVSVAGLVHLKSLSSLKQLNLMGTPVSDQELSHLSSLRNLEMIVLGDNQATSAAVDKLKGELPNLKVLQLPSFEE